MLKQNRIITLFWLQEFEGFAEIVKRHEQIVPPPSRLQYIFEIILPCEKCLRQLDNKHVRQYLTKAERQICLTL